MSYRVGVKRGKAVSVAGLVVGLLFVLLGPTFAVRVFGTFGLIGTALETSTPDGSAQIASSVNGISGLNTPALSAAAVDRIFAAQPLPNPDVAPAA